MLGGLTQGIPPQLVERPEALSGYRQVYAPQQDPNAGLNPVAYSFLRLSVGGRQWQVVSRVAANGLTIRSGPTSLPIMRRWSRRKCLPPGPAWLGAPGFMRTSYTGEPAVLPAARLIPRAAIPPRPSVAHGRPSRATPAGAASSRNRPDVQPHPATIIYRAGTDLLPLFAESLASCRRMSRGRSRFCTYFTKLPPGVDCRWRRSRRHPGSRHCP